VTERLTVVPGEGWLGLRLAEEVEACDHRLLRWSRSRPLPTLLCRSSLRELSGRVRKKQLRLPEALSWLAHRLRPSNPRQNSFCRWRTSLSAQFGSTLARSSLCARRRR
jgi:hypothetical protein